MTMTKTRPNARRSPSPPKYGTFADVLAGLGGVSPFRVVLNSHPGPATVRDLIRAQSVTDRRFELVDGFLVEKPMGGKESFLAFELGYHIRLYLQANDIGFCFGESGALRIMPRLVRAPDISFIAWSKRPDRTIPDEPVPDLVPDLAVEVISKSNTLGEMDRKLGEYFGAGVRAVWFIEPSTRGARIFTAPNDFATIGPEGSLDGGEVLPGFQLPLSKLFAKLAPPTKKRKKK